MLALKHTMMLLGSYTEEESREEEQKDRLPAWIRNLACAAA